MSVVLRGWRSKSPPPALTLLAIAASSFCLAAWLTLPLLGASQTPGRSGRMPVFVTINGADNPELIPKWLEWRSTFDSLNADGPPKGERLADTLFVHIERRLDQVAIQDAARSAATQFRGCQAKAEKQLLALQASSKMTVDQLNAAALAARIECRTIIIVARDGLQRKLSPEAWLALWQFSSDGVKGISVSIQKSELEELKLPQ